MKLPYSISRDVEALITFLTPEESGRNTPCRTGYSVQFFLDQQDWEADFAFPDREEVYPGEIVTAQIGFLRPEIHVKLGNIKVGKEFLLREGSRVVARGRITRILDLAANAKKAEAGSYRLRRQSS